MPGGVTAPEPVLVVLGEVGVEPGGDRHHVGAAGEGGDVLLVWVVADVVGAVGPGFPAKDAVNVGLASGTSGALA